MISKNKIKRATLLLSLVAIVLACFVFLPQMQAQSLPPEADGANPDGCYINFATAEGCMALNGPGGFTGLGNTALGWRSLFFSGPAFWNTGTGAGALAINTGDENTATGAGALLINLGPSPVATFNTADGAFALFQNLVATDNTAVGAEALMNSDSSGNGTANANTAVGSHAMHDNINSPNNTAVGFDALFFNDREGFGTANNNTAVGFEALGFNDFTSTGLAHDNTAVGFRALWQQGDAVGDTAVGSGALENNDFFGGGAASGNTAVGFNALNLNVDASGNTALGSGALQFNAPLPAPDLANNNTAVGAGALQFNDFSTLGLATVNTAVGASALLNNVDGDSNTAVGAFALFSNTTVAGVSGASNNAVGRQALTDNTTGFGNNGMGVNALFTNTTGSNNVAIGDDAGANIDSTGLPFPVGSANVTVGQGSAPGSGTGITTGDHNTCVGFAVGLGITSSSGNTILGAGAGPSVPFLGNNNVYIGIGETSTAFENTTIRIADMNSAAPATACFIGGILGAPNFIDTVKIDPATGRLGDQPSSERFKKDIDSMGKTSEAIFSLRPVTFHYKNDKTNTQQWGLIAEEVAKVNPALIAVDKEGKPYTVAYDKINAMLLNEFLKEHKKVEEQQASIAELKSTVGVLTAQLKEQAAQIQKVSAQVEIVKPAPQVVLNHP
jgi:trimeric autotransporter adhesin